MIYAIICSMNATWKDFVKAAFFPGQGVIATNFNHRMPAVKIKNPQPAVRDPALDKNYIGPKDYIHLEFPREVLQTHMKELEQRSRERATKEFWKEHEMRVHNRLLHGNEPPIHLTPEEQKILDDARAERDGNMMNRNGMQERRLVR